MSQPSSISPWNTRWSSVVSCVARSNSKVTAPSSAVTWVRGQLLADDADLLRQRQAPSGACVHDDRRLRGRALASVARRRRLLPDRNRRTRAEDPAGRGG